jgi:hypothetical protein
MGSLDKVFERLESLGAYAIPGEYCEPGYSTTKPDGVLFGNWNSIREKAPGLLSALEERFELAWSDEYISCGECGKYFRTSGDCWQWTMYGWIFDGDCLCGDCIKANPAEYLSHLHGNPADCEHIGLDLESLGYRNLNGTLQNGFFAGMHDDPKAIMAEYVKQYPSLDILFGKLEASQFYVKWQVYGKEKLADI